MNPLKRTYIFLFFFLIGILYGISQKPLDPDKVLEQLVIEKGNVGITAGYSVEGELQWVGAEGYACQESEVPFTKETRTRIASISKSMTAVAVMQLVEKELIDLDAPIQDYLPGFPRKEKGLITTRHLLAHTSGISQYQGEKEVENRIYYPSLKDAIKVFEERPLLFESGSAYFYTTYGYVVLGRIIEEVSGQDFEEYLRANIWDLAGMEDTGVESSRQAIEDQSCLYHKSRRKTRPGERNDLSNRIPGGGFYSTVGDVLKFGEALLNGTLLNKESVEQMLHAQDVAYDGNKYGLGWYFYGPAPYENLVIGHSGGQTGCTSQLMIVPGSGTVVVVLSNTSGTYPDIATFASELISLSEAEGK